MGKADISIEFQGLQEFEHVLKNMPQALSRKVINSALIDAAKPMASRAKANVPKKSGTLSRSIKARTAPTRIDVPAVVVGPRYGGPKNQDGWYAHFIEFGVKGIGKFKTGGGKDRKRRQPLRRRYRADIAPRPFMVPAIEQTKDEVRNRLSSSLAKALDNYVKRYNNKIKKIV
jgi:HK97 gp10 family phage protein